MPFASAALAVGGALIGGDQRNRSQSRQSRRQMDFQERMSSTAHHREVQDLRNAGLNPILSAGGAGASSPGGAMAQIQDVITPAINTGLAAYKNEADVAQIEQATAKLIEETITAGIYKGTAHYEFKSSQWNALKAEWENLATRVGYEQAEVMLLIANQQLKNAVRSGEIAETEAGKIIAWIQEIVNALSPFTGSVPQNFPRKAQ